MTNLWFKITVTALLMAMGSIGCRSETNRACHKFCTQMASCGTDRDIKSCETNCVADLGEGNKACVGAFGDYAQCISHQSCETITQIPDTQAFPSVCADRGNAFLSSCALKADPQ